MPRSSYLMHRRSRRRSIRAIAGVVVLIAGLAAFWWVSAGRTPEPVVAGHGEEMLEHTVGATNVAPTQPLPESRVALADQRSNRQTPAAAARAEEDALYVIDMGAGATTSPTKAAPITESARTAPVTPERPAAAAPERTAPAPAPTTTPSRSAQTPETTRATGPVGGAGSLSPEPVRGWIADATALANAGRLIEARKLFNRALHDDRAHHADRDVIRARMGAINDELIFSPRIANNDPISVWYTVAPGDTLSRIAHRNNTKVDWRLIQRINNISNPSRITVGQRLKLVRGPFHAVVYKHAFRLDLYHGEPDEHGNRLFIRSMPVGLGETGSTPVGTFIVRPDSKLIDPAWRNPRTGEFFPSKAPDNPLGKHWVGLDPADDATARYTEYGLHGTIEPHSIGQEMSMGCVRLLADDIALIYEVMTERVSTVIIMP
ncbi:MAG: LysM peptidoglycan-binding domain-containing protein [Phycisphaerales bacterium]|nr:MAG: LysM peptidoglycan-binding domain-containing protein [Phycisphaerales bacterium]